MDTAQQSMCGMSACDLIVKSTLLFRSIIYCPAFAKVNCVLLCHKSVVSLIADLLGQSGLESSLDGLCMGSVAERSKALD